MVGSGVQVVLVVQVEEMESVVEVVEESAADVVEDSVGDVARGEGDIVQGVKVVVYYAEVGHDNTVHLATALR